MVCSCQEKKSKLDKASFINTKWVSITDDETDYLSSSMLIIDSIGDITYQNQENSVYFSEITDYDSNHYYSFKGEIVRHTKDTIEIELNTPIRILCRSFFLYVVFP
ncbi:hypothetical protein [Flammeovirga aprica]|uniref:Uncharacterized protein n=1 Tax=Flammeovirga aprica JL-4 TaxID=694437 RepID=A0A7X9RYY2_9BACT|nr:hypothetical protein [Flammeovirga aprica]NME71255.1 hypothetical protein [Flammeovirga aprica JL-4]